MLHRPCPRSLAALAATLLITTILASTMLATTGITQATTSIQQAVSSSPQVASTAGPSNASSGSVPDAEGGSPAFIVHVSTPIANQGAPTLDVGDLEHYFANKLTELGVSRVVPYGISNAPTTSALNVFLLEVSVDSMRVSTRAAWNDTYKSYEDQDIFGVDLSLTVKHSATGRTLGATGERHEHIFVHYRDNDRLTEKRVAIFNAADNLAQRFVLACGRGQFGPELAPSESPSDWPDWLNSDNVGAGALALGVIVSLILALVILKKVASYIRKYIVHRKALAGSAHQQRTRMLNNALALFLKTANFCEEACRQAAAANKGDILAQHSAIEAKEADRLLHSTAHEQYYKGVAAAAAKKCEFTKEELLDMLRKADAWEFRVLQEAKKLAIAEAMR